MTMKFETEMGDAVRGMHAYGEQVVSKVPDFVEIERLRTERARIDADVRRIDADVRRMELRAGIVKYALDIVKSGTNAVFVKDVLNMFFST